MTLSSVENKYDRSLLYLCNTIEHYVREGGKDAMDDLHNSLSQSLSKTPEIKIPDILLIEKLLFKPLPVTKEEKKRPYEITEKMHQGISSKERRAIEMKVLKKVKNIGFHASTRLFCDSLVRRDLQHAKKIFESSSIRPNINQCIGRKTLSEGLTKKMNAIAFAIIKGDKETLKFLIENNADLTFRDQDVISPRRAISLLEIPTTVKLSEKENFTKEIIAIYERAIADKLFNMTFINFPAPICMLVAKYL